MSWYPDRWRDTYDTWKLASPPGYDYQPDCSACDDMGCPECCPLEPITLDDLDEIDEQIETARPQRAENDT